MQPPFLSLSLSVSRRPCLSLALFPLLLLLPPRCPAALLRRGCTRTTSTHARKRVSERPREPVHNTPWTHHWTTRPGLTSISPFNLITGPGRKIRPRRIIFAFANLSLSINCSASKRGFRNADDKSRASGSLGPIPGRSRCGHGVGTGATGCRLDKRKYW